MSDYILRDAATQAKPEFLNENHEDAEKALFAKGWNACNNAYIDNLSAISPADVRPVARGVWEQREVFDARGKVYELQSTFCPVCKRYHTTPYLYNFTHYDYCPHCGAKMDEIDKSIDAHAKRGHCGRADMRGETNGE